MAGRNGERVKPVSTVVPEDAPRGQDLVRNTLGLSTRVAIADIRRDGGTQPRARLNEDIISDYAEDMKKGDKFPPIVVFYDGSFYWLADGFHRVAAAERCDLAEIEADVKQGNLRDAIRHSLGVNSAHGFRRTSEDKKRAVILCLEDEEWSTAGHREIARLCHVSPTFVGNVEKEWLSVHRGQMRPEERQVTRGGKTYRMKTGNIGETPKKKAPTPPADPQPAPVISEEEIRLQVLEQLYGAAENLKQLGVEDGARDLALYAHDLAVEWGLGE